MPCIFSEIHVEKKIRKGQAQLKSEDGLLELFLLIFSWVFQSTCEWNSPVIYSKPCFFVILSLDTTVRAYPWKLRENRSSTFVCPWRCISGMYVCHSLLPPLMLVSPLE